MIDIIPELMTSLSVERPIFHSEADFQHAFAWELHNRFLPKDDDKVRLEFPLSVEGKGRRHLDLWAMHEGQAIAVELKYKTGKFSTQFGGEDFHLTYHGAKDCGRYDFIKDVKHLEEVTTITSMNNVCGYAILLTNDSSYWSPPNPNNSPTIDAAFRLQEGCSLSGELKWGDKTGQGTMKGRESPLSIRGDYDLKWQQYSNLNGEGSGGDFRYLMISVLPPA